MLSLSHTSIGLDVFIYFEFLETDLARKTYHLYNVTSVVRLNYHSQGIICYSV